MILSSLVLLPALTIVSNTPYSRFLNVFIISLGRGGATYAISKAY
jgi:hypothetical protein